MLYKPWWPESLWELNVGGYFEEEIDEVVWSSSLQWLFFGREFNQPIDEVA